MFGYNTVVYVLDPNKIAVYIYTYILHTVLDTFFQLTFFLFQEQKKELTAENIMLWEKITELSSRGILKIVDFAKKIPGFLSLPTSDQITLLKAACLEIMVG